MTDEELPPPRRQLSSIVAAVVVVMALVGGLIAVQLSRSGEEAEAQILAFAFAQGQTVTYAVHMTMDGEVAMEGFGEPSPEPSQGEIHVDVTETMTWKVLSVDDRGVATVEVSITDVSESGNANGEPITLSASTPSPTKMKIAPDGRFMQLDGVSVPISLQGTFLGLDQYAPLLPGHPVEPGDSWTTTYSQDNGFDEGKIEVTTVSTFDRYETVDGTRAAVITTNAEVPLDITIDLDEIPGDSGGFEDQTASGDRPLSGVFGEVRVSQTSWVDPSGKQLLRSSITGDVDITLEFSGELSGGPTGTEDMNLTLALQLDSK